MKGKYVISELVTVSLGLLSCQSQPTEKVRPNVIFILADDLGWTDLSCYGSSFYETPNLDQLAKEGARFTNAYAACPVSSPTRASFQTGKYPARLHLTDYIPGGYAVPARKKIIDERCPVLPVDFVQNMPLEELTIGEAFKQEGYQTAHIGKWNCSVDSLTYPQYQGYDINVAGCNKGGPGKGGYFSPYHNPYLKDGSKGEYLTDRLGDECIQILRQFQKGPFFISLPFYQVHTPLLAKSEKVKYFEEKARRMRLDTCLTFDENPEWKSKQPYQDASYKERLIHSNATYAAMLASMDENIGRIINELKHLNLYDNTILVFTSDNGGLATSEGSPTSNRPLRGGKGFTYEGGIREPLIVRIPHVTVPGTIYDEVITSTDYYPTLLEMTNSEMQPQQHLDGISFLSLLNGKEEHLNREAIYWHFPHYANQGGRPSGAIRWKNYKLIEFYDTGEIELYDLSKDISEKYNLAKQSEALAKVLLDKLQHWRTTVDAAMPVANPLFMIRK